VCNLQIYSTGVQPLYGKGPHRLLWVASQAARGKTTKVVHLTA